MLKENGTIMDSATKILDIAERRMRLTGYNAVSYRDIAQDMGIKSSSLHYHFPKKEDLGAALVQRYSDNFSGLLSQINLKTGTAQDNIQAFTQIYGHELKQRRLLCLCAVLGAEAGGLPARVSSEVNQFFAGNIDWLEQQYKTLGAKTPKQEANTTLSLLTGSMMISAVNHDHSVFDAAVDLILGRAARLA